MILRRISQLLIKNYLFMCSKYKCWFYIPQAWELLFIKITLVLLYSSNSQSDNTGQQLFCCPGYESDLRMILCFC